MKNNFNTDENKAKLTANTNLVKSKSFLLFTIDDITKNISVNLYTDMNTLEFAGFMQFIIHNCKTRLSEFIDDTENKNDDTDEEIDDNFN